jgi:hypothetical protein
MNRTWATKALVATLLLGVAMVAVAAKVPEHVRAHTEASMLLTGKISINADGSVAGYEILHADKVPDYVLSNLAQWVPDWRFKPVLVGGKAAPARATMTVRMLARPSGEDKFEVSIAGTSFGLDGWRPTDNVERLEMKPPHYPRDVVRAGGQGTAYLVLKVGRQGTVEDVVVERVNLSVYASEREMDRFRKRLGAAAAKAAWDWTFIPPSTGDLAQDAWWSVRVPVDFTLGRETQAAYGEWIAYLPGPYQSAPWLESDEAGSDALADGEMQTMGSGPVLMSPLQG